MYASPISVTPTHLLLDIILMITFANEGKELGLKLSKVEGGVGVLAKDGFD